MPSKATREYYLERNTALVEEFCTKNVFRLKSLNSGYHLRVNDIIDYYPVNGRWHVLATNERGYFHDINSIADAYDIADAATPAPFGDLKHLPVAHQTLTLSNSSEYMRGPKGEQGEQGEESPFTPSELVEIIEANAHKSKPWWQFWRRK